LAVSNLGNGGVNSSIGASSSAPSNLVLAGGALSYIGGDASSDRGFTLQTRSAIDVTDPAATLTLSGVATGPAGFAKGGAGKLVLSGNNTLAGNVAVNGGVLAAGSSQAFGTGTMTVNSGTLDLNNFSNSVAGLIGPGAVSLGAGSLTVTHGYNSSFSGTIGGSGGFIKSGAGQQTLSGCGNSYIGPTTISGGTLIVDCIRDGGVASSIGASTQATSSSPPTASCNIPAGPSPPTAASTWQAAGASST
jgi:fibronectin-binding autotransporter adhesin